jgi:3-methyladenine DNA glycosylase/8-oxoguanine DNA glycosylase
VPGPRLIRELPDDKIIERLTAIRGVGRWTVEMLLISRLGRPDILPLDDFGVRKGFGSVFKKNQMPTKEEMTKRGERWAPYRSVASWYLWRAADIATQRERVKKTKTGEADAAPRPKAKKAKAPPPKKIQRRA